MKFRVFGFGAIILAKGSAYSAYAPVNCSLVAPYTSSPRVNPGTLAPTALTMPDNSEPRIRGRGSGMPLLPSRMSASQGPTPRCLYADRQLPSGGFRPGQVIVFDHARWTEV